MAKTMRMEYPIAARWQKNMTRLHANQPVFTAHCNYTIVEYSVIHIVCTEKKY